MISGGVEIPGDHLRFIDGSQRLLDHRQLTPPYVRMAVHRSVRVYTFYGRETVFADSVTGSPPDGSMRARGAAAVRPGTGGSGVSGQRAHKPVPIAPGRGSR